LLIQPRDDDREFARGERVYIGRTRSDENEALHIERYRFAQGVLDPNLAILDAGSGCGFGTQTMGRDARTVVGLALSWHALQFARRNHGAQNIAFVCANLNESLPFGDEAFDAIVSFETLEHVANHKLMLAEFRRVLKPGGHLVISTPDKSVYDRTLTVKNQFHVNELDRAEFVTNLTTQFELRSLYGQLTYAPSRLHAMGRLALNVDIWGLRDSKLGRLPGVSRLRKALRPVRPAPDGSNIEPIRVDTPRRHVYLVAVAVKDQRPDSSRQ